MNKNYFSCWNAKEAVMKLVMKSKKGYYLYSDVTSAAWYYGYDDIIRAVSEYIRQCDKYFYDYESIELYQRNDKGKWVLKKSKYSDK